MEFATITDHPFLKTVMDDNVALQRATGFNVLTGPDDSFEFDECQFYIQRVGFALSHAYGWVTQLNHAIHFMTDFGYGRQAQQLRIKRPDHLLYSIENYLIRLQSIYDRCLQLTNAVFHLCISDEHVAHAVIVSNLFVARTPVPKLLKAVRKTIDSHAQDRHRLIHRHSHIDPSLRRIEVLYMHSKETWDHPKQIPFERLVAFRAERVRTFTKNKKAEFIAINTALLAALEPLFNEMLVQYEKQKSRLKKLV